MLGSRDPSYSTSVFLGGIITLNSFSLYIVINMLFPEIITYTTNIYAVILLLILLVVIVINRVKLEDNMAIFKLFSKKSTLFHFVTSLIVVIIILLTYYLFFILAFKMKDMLNLGYSL